MKLDIASALAWTVITTLGLVLAVGFSQLSRETLDVTITYEKY